MQSTNGCVLSGEVRPGDLVDAVWVAGVSELVVDGDFPRLRVGLGLFHFLLCSALVGLLAGWVLIGVLLLGASCPARGRTLRSFTLGLLHHEQGPGAGAHAVLEFPVGLFHGELGCEVFNDLVVVSGEGFES